MCLSLLYDGTHFHGGGRGLAAGLYSGLNCIQNDIIYLDMNFQNFERFY